MTHPTDAERMRDKCAAHLHALLAHEQDMVVHALEVRPISTESLRDAMYRAGTCEGYRLAEAAIRALPASDGAANDEAARGRVRTDAGRLVGALLDAWDGVPNDERPPKLERPFRAIYAAIEDETFYATPAPSRPADDAVARAREAVVDAAKRVRKEREYREQTSMCDNYTDHARSRQREQDAIEDLLRAALAAERAAKGGDRG